MNLFMTKKKRALLALKEQQAIEAKRQKELQAKMNVKKTLIEMKSQSKRLEQFKQTYINKGRKALSLGNEQSYRMAKSGLKTCLAKQKYLDTMIVNFEMAIELNDMNKVVGQFVQGINIISEQMKEITSTIDFTKAQNAFDQAMTNNATQYEALESFLAQAVDSFETVDISNAAISDDEIDILMSNNQMDVEHQIDREIDEKIKEVKTKLAN